MSETTLQVCVRTAKRETNVQDGISTLESTKPLDVFNEMPGHFPLISEWQQNREILLRHRDNTQPKTDYF